ncbi:MAG: hypothetical protein KGV51_08330 [Moraxellaceae bacterium]|nr:hypothetical protein [Moraxellaceae bacterium]
MNILNQFNQLLNRQELAIATITANRGGGKLVAKTESNATVILSGNLEIGKKCFYDRRTSKIISEAPNVEFREYGV